MNLYLESVHAPIFHNILVEWANINLTTIGLFNEDKLQNANNPLIKSKNYDSNILYRFNINIPIVEADQLFLHCRLTRLPVCTTIITTNLNLIY